MPRTSQNLPVLLSVKQTADWLGVSAKTVRRWLASSQLPHHRIGRSIRIAEPDLIAFITIHRAM
jgi:excisionase family DNA binding protein